MTERRSPARGGSPDVEALRHAIRSVRRRYRLRVALQGSAIVLGLALVLVLGSSFFVDRLRFEPGAVLAFRIGLWALVAAAAGWFLLRPLLRRLPDGRVALYLEEHEPSLEASVLTAVEASGPRDGDASVGREPDGIARGLLRAALARLRSVERGRRVERPWLRNASAWLAGAAVAGLAAFALGPSWVGDAGPLLLAPWRSAEAASPYAIDVEPGNIRVPRGADQKLTAATRGFEAQDAETVVRRGEGAWERLPMAPGPEGTRFEILLFDLQEATEYLVEAEGVRSPIYRIEVVDVPYVDRIDLEYRFPDYSGLEPRLVEDGGDIAALRGTRVTLRITPTIPVEGGRVTFDAEGAAGPEHLELGPGPGGALQATLEVDDPGFYRVQLRGSDGDFVTASADYRVEPLDDQPPIVTVSKPGRDLRPTSIEEVFIEVEAEDDHGVGSVELAFSVNGGPERRVSLYGGGGRRTFTGGHTLFLEEMELEPGDLVSYWARAADRNVVTGPGTAMSDIYFLAIRPFDRSFRQADQAPGPGGGGGLGGALSEQQRQIIAATFNLVRDRETYGDSELREHLTTLALIQGRLREEVARLVGQMRQRGIAADSTFRTVAEELPRAAVAMGEAEERLGEGRPDEALPPEQRALQHLQRAEAAFREVQVALGGQGGGGGGASPDAEELADLFELELDRLRNQYETVRRGERRERDEAVDEALQRLRELARRQEQLNERARRAAQGARAGSGGSAQRQLIQETEELARQLERLSRERADRELAASARRLQEAADRMRRASGKAGESGEAGGEALQRLREARRALEQRREAALGREVEDASRRARRIAEREREIARDLERLLARGVAADREAARRIAEAKDELAAEVGSLESDLDRLARETRRERPDVSRELESAAGGIRDDKLREKILYSRGLLDGRSSDYARRFEEEIEENTQSLAEAVERAARALREGEAGDLERRLDEARDLVRGLESLRDRVRERAEAAARGEPGRGGEGGEAGRQGEGGQQGQGGQQGEGGQPGQGGEADAPGVRPGGLGPGGGGAGLASGDVRQFRREFRERREEAERLRRELEAAGVDADELAAAIARLRELDAERVYQDLEEIERLQEAVIRGLKEFEFVLRRDLLGPEERKLFLSGSDEVPEGYRELVEAYYRSLAEDPPR